MKIDKKTKEFLSKYAKFDENGLLIDLYDINDDIINAIDEEFICSIHDELKDRYEIFLKKNPHSWYEKKFEMKFSDCHSTYNEMKDLYPVIKTNPIYSKLALDASFFYDLSFDDVTKVNLNQFESYIRRNRNVYFEDLEKEIYGYKANKEFYKKLICGNTDIVISDRHILCRTVKTNNELIFYREETNNDICITPLEGNEIEFVFNNTEKINVKLDPIRKSIYCTLLNCDNPDGITTTQIVNSSNLKLNYKKLAVNKDLVALDEKKIKDYISRLNNNLQEQGIPLECRVKLIGNNRCIPYIKYNYNQRFGARQSK